MKPANEGKPPCSCCYATLTFDCPICKKKIMVYEVKHNQSILTTYMDSHIAECKKQ